MIQSNIKQVSKLLIVSNKSNNATLLKTLLSNYFQFVSENIINLTTKYYKTNIQITVQSWPAAPQSNSSQSQAEIQPNQADKQDLLIMLVGQQQSFQPEIYDCTINKYNPDNFILIVNMSSKDKKWKDQEIIATQVNNFIEIIKQNLDQLYKNPPKREKSGLLADNFQQGSVFSLLELIQTTQWSCIQRIQQTKKIKKQEPAQPKAQKQQTALTAQISNEQKAIQQKVEKQMAQEQLQQQMLMFETMMRDMLSIKQMGIKPQGVADNERKKKAEELINTLLKGNFM